MKQFIYEIQVENYTIGQVLLKFRRKIKQFFFWKEDAKNLN